MEHNNVINGLDIYLMYGMSNICTQMLSYDYGIPLYGPQGLCLIMLKHE